MRARFSTLIALCTIFLLYTCTPAPLKVGLSALLSGHNSELGYEVRNALQIAITEYNQSGGIQGRQIQLVEMDDQSSVQIGVKNDLDFVNQGGFLIFGHVLSNQVDTIEKVLALSKNQLVYISPTISSQRLSGRDDMFIRTIPSVDLQGMAFGNYLKKLNYKKIIAVYDASNATYAKALADFTQESLEASHSSTLEKIAFDAKTQTHMQIAQNIVDTPHDAILLVLSGYDCAMIAQNLRKMQDASDLFGSNWSRTNEVISVGGKAVEGMRFMANVESQPLLPRAAAFREQYQKDYGTEPGFASFASYEAAYITFDTLRRLQVLDAKSLKNQLLKTSQFNGIHGLITIDRYGDANKDLYVFAILNGTFVMQEKGF